MSYKDSFSKKSLRRGEIATIFTAIILAVITTGIFVTNSLLKKTQTTKTNAQTTPTTTFNAPTNGSFIDPGTYTIRWTNTGTNFFPDGGTLIVNDQNTPQSPVCDVYNPGSPSGESCVYLTGQNQVNWTFPASTNTITGVRYTITLNLSDSNYGTYANATTNIGVNLPPACIPANSFCISSGGTATQGSCCTGTVCTAKYLGSTYLGSICEPPVATATSVPPTNTPIPPTPTPTTITSGVWTHTMTCANGNYSYTYSTNGQYTGANYCVDILVNGGVSYSGCTTWTGTKSFSGPYNSFYFSPNTYNMQGKIWNASRTQLLVDQTISQQCIESAATATPTTPPGCNQAAAPTGVTGVRTSSTSTSDNIRLTWNAVAGITSYAIYRTTDNGNTWNWSADVENALVKDLPADKTSTYKFKVAANSWCSTSSTYILGTFSTPTNAIAPLNSTTPTNSPTPTLIPVTCATYCTDQAACAAGTVCSTTTHACVAQPGYTCSAAPTATKTPTPTPTLIPVNCPTSCTQGLACPNHTTCSTATSSCVADSGYQCSNIPTPTNTPTATPAGGSQVNLTIPSDNQHIPAPAQINFTGTATNTVATVKMYVLKASNNQTVMTKNVTQFTNQGIANKSFSGSFNSTITTVANYIVRAEALDSNSTVLDTHDVPIRVTAANATNTPTPTNTPAVTTTPGASTTPAASTTPTCSTIADPVWNPGAARNGTLVTAGWSNERDGLTSKVEVSADGGGSFITIFEGVTSKTHQITQDVPETANRDIIVKITASDPACNLISGSISMPLSKGTGIGVLTPVLTITTTSSGATAIIIAGGAFLLVLLIGIGLLGI